MTTAQTHHPARSWLARCSTEELLGYVAKYVRKQLLSKVLPVALEHSGKDRVTAFAGRSFTRNFVAQAKGFETLTNTNVLAEPLGRHAAIDGTSLVANANDVVDSAAAELTCGFSFDGRQYLLIVGAWSRAIQELRSHSVVSHIDLVFLQAIAVAVHARACDLA